MVRRPAEWCEKQPEASIRVCTESEQSCGPVHVVEVFGDLVRMTFEANCNDKDQPSLVRSVQPHRKIVAHVESAESEI